MLAIVEAVAMPVVQEIHAHLEYAVQMAQLTAAETVSTSVVIPATVEVAAMPVNPMRPVLMVPVSVATPPAVRPAARLVTPVVMEPV